MHARSNRWAAFLIAVVVAAVVGYGAYNLGMSHGLALSTAVSATPPAGNSPVVAYPYYGYWHRPWGFGLFFPFFFLAFWFVIARTLFWRGPWRHRWHGAGPDDLPPGFDHWHRRAHERMKTDPPTN